jgi:hypothetical protein
MLWRKKKARKKAANHVVSLWHGSHNVGVVSTTDEEFLEHLKKWAELKGYTVKGVEADES